MKDEEKRRRLQGLLAQMDLERNRAEGVAGQMRLVETALAEMTETRKSLTELGKGRKDASILVPLGSGSYLKAKVEDSDSILVGVGAGVSIEKKIPEAEEMLNKREEEYGKTMGALRSAMDGMFAKISELNDEAEQLAGELGGKIQ